MTTYPIYVRICACGARVLVDTIGNHCQLCGNTDSPIKGDPLPYFSLLLSLPHMPLSQNTEQTTIGKIFRGEDLFLV